MINHESWESLRRQLSRESAQSRLRCVDIVGKILHPIIWRHRISVIPMLYSLSPICTHHFAKCAPSFLTAQLADKYVHVVYYVLSIWPFSQCRWVVAARHIHYLRPHRFLSAEFNHSIPSDLSISFHSEILLGHAQLSCFVRCALPMQKRCIYLHSTVENEIISK